MALTRSHTSNLYLRRERRGRARLQHRRRACTTRAVRRRPATVSYNDIAVAIQLAARHGARVLYTLIDEHHGCGVQWVFYYEPNVLTVSLLESGAWLYPSTGFIDKRGEGMGSGIS